LHDVNKESIALRGDLEGDFFTVFRGNLWMFRVDFSEKSHFASADALRSGKLIFLFMTWWLVFSILMGVLGECLFEKKSKGISFWL
jgi:hypothetical protein